MKESLKTKLIDLTVGAITAAILLAQIPAAALPSVGSLRNSVNRQTTDPRIVLEASFSQLFDRKLSQNEIQQIDVAMKQYFAERARPKILTVAYNAEDSRTEIKPVFCLYGRASFSLTKLGSVKLEGLGVNGELVGCILTNDSNPFSWNYREFRSYIMEGIGGGSMGPNGGLGGGVMIGVYMGPTNTTKPMIGSYTYGRISLEKSVFRGSIMIAKGTNEMNMALLSAGAEFSWKTIIDTIKIVPKLSIDQVGKLGRLAKRDIKNQWNSDPAGIKAGGGFLINVKEFPWFERIFVQGMNPIAAFSDLSQYLAANN